MDPLVFGECYDLADDPTEAVSLLNHEAPGNDPRPKELIDLGRSWSALATCQGSGCAA